jgi:hypothetical protein
LEPTGKAVLLFIFISIVKKPLTTLFVSIILVLIIVNGAAAQRRYKPIPLPDSLRNVNFEFSGLCWNYGRLFLLPQYGNHKQTKLNGQFNIYSILADSIGRVVDGKDSTLTAFNTIRVNNLDKLPDSIKQHYEGFEAITMDRDRVFLAIETEITSDYCYILKGKLNQKHDEIDIDTLNYISLKRYPYIVNAGFESLTYLPKKHRLIAIYEYNGMDCGGIGFQIDPEFKKPAKKLGIPFVPFRITDVQSANGKDLYALNFHYNGDYMAYLNNNMLRHPEAVIKATIPDLKDSLEKDSLYLQRSTTNYARIIKMDGLKAGSWKQVASFPAIKSNWEGLALYRNGALVISDANRSSKLVTTLAFVGF